jgi:CRISPR/Cas system CSM-associated protein Csm3 (group 7 of RAMP superfamily)
MNAENRYFRPLRYIVTFQWKTASGLRIGSGKDDVTDSDVLIDSEGKPFVPGTSLTGIFRHWLTDCSKSELADQWLGYVEGEDSSESRLIVGDAFCTGHAPVMIRDGVRINNSRGMAEDRGKFDFQVVPVGQVFAFRVELESEVDNQNEAEELITLFTVFLNSDSFRLGAAAGCGFGKGMISSLSIQTYDLSLQNELRDWLLRKNGKVWQLNTPLKEFNQPTFYADIEARIEDSLLIRDYVSSGDESDAMSMKWKDNQYYLPGSSLRGALRARTERILKLFPNQDGVLRNIFGHVGVEGKQKDSRRGKLVVNDGEIQGVVSETQSRVKIDRFTGGTMDTALFQSSPLFPDLNDKDGCPGLLKFGISLKNPDQSEVGLFLLVIRDLLTGQLPVGGEKSIGRGRMRLDKIHLKWLDHESSLYYENDQIRIEGQSAWLNECINSFCQGGAQ